VKSSSNILTVGATNRNLGKTEFICRLLERFHKKKIVAIKIKTLYTGDSHFHGKGTVLKGNYLIREENFEEGLDDSKRFITAGASKVFYIKSKIDFLEIAIEEILGKFPHDQLFISESNSLLKFHKPGVFIMITGPDQSIYKPSSLEYMEKADLIIKSDGRKFDTDPEEITLMTNKSSWEI
jgi:hypothetical protein